MILGLHLRHYMYSLEFHIFIAEMKEKEKYDCQTYRKKSSVFYQLKDGSAYDDTARILLENRRKPYQS